MIQDLRYALRSLLRSPSFTLVAVLTLALGIGATTAIFSLFDAIVLKSLPVRDPQQLYSVGAGHYPLYQALRNETRIFADVLAAAPIERLPVAVEGGQPEATRVSLVSASYFSTLGVSAAVGRVFGPIDDRAPGEPAIAVASYGYWRQRLAHDPAVVGRVVYISGVPITIVGVAPSGFFGEEVGASPDFWVPLTMWAQIVPGRDLLNSPGTSWLRIVGRLRPGVEVPRADASLTLVFRGVLEQVFGRDTSADVRRDIERSRIRLIPADKGVSSVRQRFAQPLQLLLAAVALVLLICCANVANLLLARSAMRRREIDVRFALGMSRVRLIRQLLSENLLLAAFGGSAGIALAWLGREALLRLISADGSRLPLAVETDLRVLAFVSVLSVATAFLFGSVPAWRAVRASVVSSLASRHAAGARGSQLLSPILVIAQVAISLVLLMGAGLFLRTLSNLHNVDLGFVPEQLVVMDVNPQAAGYSGTRAADVTHRLLERLRTVPAVSAASFSENGVMFGRDSGTNLMRPQGFVSGPEGYPRARWDIVGPDYFSTMAIPLVAGRDFSERDNESAPRVIAINETMAKRFFGAANPIGRRLVWGDPDVTDFEIVAVARDVKQGSPRDEPQPRFYLPYAQMSVTRPSWILASVQFMVRTSADSAAVVSMLQRVVQVEDPRLTVSGVYVAPELVDRALVQERMIAKLSIAFGSLAVVLACIGLYGLIAYQVVQRTSEIGIRMALGAQRTEVLRATLRRALLWTTVGVVIGMPVAMGASRVAESLLFGLSATDPATLAGAAALMLTFGLLAAYIPARRASRIDPIAALKYE
jgi:predicted permease